MNFWTGFLAGIATTWLLATGAGAGFAWYLNRASKVPGPPVFDYAAWGLEDVGEVAISGTYDDTVTSYGAPTEIPYSHVTNISRHVRGDG